MAAFGQLWKWRSSLAVSLALAVCLCSGGMASLAIAAGEEKAEAAAGSEQDEAFPYVALGDLLMAGHLPAERDLIKGAGHMAAEQLSLAAAGLVPFANAFTDEAMSAAQLLELLERDARDPGGAGFTISRQVRAARIVTVSTGFVDLFGGFDRESAAASLESEASEQAYAALSERMAAISRLLHEWNPGLRVYWLMYYNPFTAAEADDERTAAAGEQGLRLRQLNETIERAAAAAGDTAVRTDDVIALYPELYLTPSSHKMRPSLIGYRAIGKRIAQAALTDLGTERTFGDLPDNDPASAALLKLAARQVLHGHQDGTMRPEAPARRAEAALMLYRALCLQYNPLLATASYVDVPASFFAYEEVRMLKERGVLEDGERFAPYAALTREEARTWLQRAYRLSDQEAAALTAATLLDGNKSKTVSRRQMAEWIAALDKLPERSDQSE